MTLVRSEVHGNVLVVSLDRPESRNAITLPMAKAIAAELDLFENSTDLRVAVLYGQGGTFSAGMDLKAFRATGDRPVDTNRGGGGLVWQPPRKPIIAAIEGYALGLGFEMALACDLLVAAKDAQFGLPEVTHGLVAAGGGALRLPSRIPRPAAMEILLTGRRVGASRLHELGLINEVTEPGEALACALDLAEHIAGLPPAGVEVTKTVVNESRDWPENEMFARLEALLTDVFSKWQQNDPQS